MEQRGNSYQLDLFSLEDMEIEELSNINDVSMDEQEDESDLNISRLENLSQVVVTGTDWTTETILNQLKKGNIILDPKYQRRDAWSIKHKSRFIESLFLGMPIPQIMLAELKNARGKYLVIDGKQRLLSLRQFAAGTDEQEGFAQLKLRGLELKSEFNGLSYVDIEEQGLYPEEIAAFQNQTIRTVVVKNWTDEEFLYLLFLRLNTGSVKLSPQELRQALHPGGFVDFADDFTSRSELLKNVLKLKKPDFRMRDVEIFIRYFAFKFFLTDYAGDMKKFLDVTCERLNEIWKRKSSIIEDEALAFEKAIETTRDIFGAEVAFKKWKNGKFESKFNRTVFDIMLYYFSDNALAEKALQKKNEIVRSFVDVCENDSEFLTSLETTTKTIHATWKRYETWARILQGVLETPIRIPKLEENRIVF
ncbi:DUF262 domain-containing protein [Cohnella hashimotonis]|uniref:DUF262 domain-containing protein n=1 Tax=Cohnella hashimotonis TaxID=2826895 RepID=A0ABT6TUI4_9BACL|nr:DUF262 domain-containing protein [Cohnella hashimotonis]MDI4649584.1 DUF262 domain-containing protein [Cohnella hashimotonis]